MATPPIRAVDVVLESGVSQAENNGAGCRPTTTLKVYGLENVYVIGDTVDLPVSKAGGSCHNQAPVIANNIAGEIRLGQVCSAYDGRVQAVAQMGLNAGMPLWYDYTHDVLPTPPTKLGGLLRHGFNRGLYWAVARNAMNAPHEGTAALPADTPASAPSSAAGRRARPGRPAGPVAEAGRLDIADLLSLASDLVDLLDQSMVEKLALLSEQATSAAWIAANTLRDAHARTLREERPPSLTGLIGLLRDEDTRRGMPWRAGAADGPGARTTRTPRGRAGVSRTRARTRARGAAPRMRARKTGGSGRAASHRAPGSRRTAAGAGEDELPSASPPAPRRADRTGLPGSAWPPGSRSAAGSRA